MKLEDKITIDLKTAMKAKNLAALRGIRAIKAALQLAKTDGSGVELDSAGEIKLLQKLVKQRQESRDIYIKQERKDLAMVEEEEIEVIKKYLPKAIDQSELEKIINKLITQTGASGMKDMGRVMGQAAAELGGKADGKTIALIVKKILSNG